MAVENRILILLFALSERENQKMQNEKQSNFLQLAFLKTELNWFANVLFTSNTIYCHTTLSVHIPSDFVHFITFYTEQHIFMYTGFVNNNNKWKKKNWTQALNINAIMRL